jgi:hypothetical protein
MTEYNVYGIYYEDYLWRKSCAIVSAKSDVDAIGLLEEYLKEKDKENNERSGSGRGSIHPTVKSLGIKVLERKILFGFDVWTDSEL